MSEKEAKRVYSTKEEIANAITHGIGALLAIAALAILVVFAAIRGNVWHIVSFSVYGSTLVLLYFASTLYHSLTNQRAKGVFHKFDHISIYLLIAGTYTPFCLTALRGHGEMLFERYQLKFSICAASYTLQATSRSSSLIKLVACGVKLAAIYIFFNKFVNYHYYSTIS